MKKIFAVIIFLLMTFSTCFAKNILVTGQGSTERSAIKNAMRMAIEQELGAVIDSKTLVQNHQVISDKISTDSEGFISGYEIISKRVENGIFFVTIRADVNSQAVKTHLMSYLQKKSVVDTNADSPRIAVLAYDNEQREYSEVENEILSALQRQGFTRIVDLNQINRAVKRRIISAENDTALIKTLTNDFHIDYLVMSEVKISADKNISLASRLISVNTGKIIYAGNSYSNAGMFTANTDSIKIAARRAGYEISNAALNSAAKIEQHIILFISESTFRKIGGTLTAVVQRAESIDGVNDAFVRNMSGSLELDVDYDGTAADFALELERAGFKILEVTADYIRI